MSRNLVVRVAVLLVIAGLSSSPTLLAQSTPAPGSPLALREHPRIWVNSRTLSEIRSRLGSGGVWHSQFQEWVSWADRYRSSALSASIYDANYVPGIYGFIYATYPVPGISYGASKNDYGSVARSGLMRMPGLWPTPGTLENVYYAVLGYDWVWPLLSASDKSTLMAWFKLTYEGNTPHPFNALQVLGRTTLLLEGIATYGDGVDDAWAAARVGDYAKFFTDQTGVTRAESDLVGEDGGYSEGDSYAFGYSFAPILAAEEAWRTANGLTRLAHYSSPTKSVIRRIPLHVANTILPWAVPNASSPGGRKYVFWKSHYMTANWKAAEPLQQLWLAAAVGVLADVDPDMAGLGQWLIDNRIGVLPSSETYYLRSWLLRFAIGGRTVAKSPSSLKLPLSRAARDGRYIFRTGYEGLTDSYVTITFSEWHRGITSPQYPGGFTIDRKGPQVIRQGGTSGHDPGKFSAGPANILTFTDRSRTSPTHPEYDDQGGQRVFGTALTGSHDFIQGGPNDLRGNVRYLGADLSAARDVDYVGADITPAYNSTRYHDSYNPARVSDVNRQFVYFRPATPGTDSDIVVVFDRAMTTDTKFEKAWLFHTATDPSINGSETAGQPVRGGSGAGKWTYTGATRVTATNTVAGSNGRTFLTPLLPASRRIVKVGGPNSSGQPWQPGSHEFEGPYGDLRPPNAVPDAETDPYVGRYRIEIIPTTPSLSDVFLNVVEVADSTVASPTPASVLTSTGIVAARIGTRVVTFNRVAGDVASGDITMDQAGTFRFHFAELVPHGEYRVAFGGVTVTRPASAAGTIYLEQFVSVGTRVTVTATGTVERPAAPAPPTNVRIIG